LSSKILSYEGERRKEQDERENLKKEITLLSVPRLHLLRKSEVEN
jgi:hypothetical protein